MTSRDGWSDRRWGLVLALDGVSLWFLAVLSDAYTSEGLPWRSPAALLDAAVWTTSTWLAEPGLSATETVAYAGLALALGGPLWFWVLRPLRARAGDAPGRGIVTRPSTLITPRFANARRRIAERLREAGRVGSKPADVGETGAVGSPKPGDRRAPSNREGRWVLDVPTIHGIEAIPEADVDLERGLPTFEDRPPSPPESEGIDDVVDVIREAFRAAGAVELRSVGTAEPELPASVPVGEVIGPRIAAHDEAADAFRRNLVGTEPRIEAATAAIRERGREGRWIDGVGDRIGEIHDVPPPLTGLPTADRDPEAGVRLAVERSDEARAGIERAVARRLPG